MKTCPTCGTSYSDELSFCLQDGTGLIARPTSELANSPTEVYRAVTNEDEDISLAQTLVSAPNPISPPPKQFQISALMPVNRTGCVVTVGQVSALVMLVFGLGFFGFYYMKMGGNELAYSSNASQSYSNKPVTSYNTSANSASSNSANFASANTTGPTPIEPKTVDQGVVNGLAKSLPQPGLPEEARTAGVSGTVRVQVLIDENGRVITANAVSGHRLLTGVAVEAARSVEFNPTLRNGKQVRVSGILVYEFAP